MGEFLKGLAWGLPWMALATGHCRWELRPFTPGHFTSYPPALGWVQVKVTFGLYYWDKSMAISMLVNNKHFLTWLLIDWWLCCQWIGSQVRFQNSSLVWWLKMQCNVLLNNLVMICQHWIGNDLAPSTDKPLPQQCWPTSMMPYGVTWHSITMCFFYCIKSCKILRNWIHIHYYGISIWGIICGY